MSDRLDTFQVSGGAEGSRTPVQTRNPRAFYTLSRHLILLSASGRRQPNTKPSPSIQCRSRDTPQHGLQIVDTPYDPPLWSGTSGRDTRRTTASGHAIKPAFPRKLGSECIAVIAICSLSLRINEPPHRARRAYCQTLPAVKTGQPRLEKHLESIDTMQR